MLRSVLANRDLPSSRDVFGPCKAILESFHSAKNDRQLQAMVCRLWRPVLWRHFKVANGVARRNAAEILFDAFPVENPDDPIEERDLAREEQLKVRNDAVLKIPNIRFIMTISRALGFS